MAKKTITPAAIEELQKINWPGNIREFRNVLERLIILSGPTIDAAEVVSYAQPISRGSMNA